MNPIRSSQPAFGTQVQSPTTNSKKNKGGWLPSIDHTKGFKQRGGGGYVNPSATPGVLQMLKYPEKHFNFN